MGSGQQYARSTGWGGWIAFAALMMIMTGVFNIIDGLVALVQDEVFVKGDAGAVLIDITAWGWIHLISGVVLMLAGFALFQGAFWARIVAVIAVMVNGATQALFLPAYPFWSMLIIVVNLLILWALVVHGDEKVGVS